MTLQNPNPNKGIESNMATNNFGDDPCDLSTSDDPVTRSITPRRVSHRSRPQEGSVTR